MLMWKLQHKSNMDSDKDEHLAKKVKFDVVDNVEKVDGLKEMEVHIDCVSLQQEAHILHVPDDEKRQELNDCLQKGLPSDSVIHFGHHSATCQQSGFQKTKLANTEFNNGGRSVLGTELRSFTIDDDVFVISHCKSSDEEASIALQRLEKLAMWFIETADSVDFFRNPQWELLFLYQKHKLSDDEFVYSYAGYVTLFTFHTPLCGSRLRLCQILVLPQYQSKGLGRELVLEVYALAKQRGDIIEVTVEDPCPGFQRLREVVDVEWALRGAAGCLPSAGLELKTRLEAVLAQDDDALGSQLKIIKSQVLFVKDALQYLQLVLSLSDDFRQQPISNNAQISCGEDLSDQPLAEKLKWIHHAVQKHSRFPEFRLKSKRTLLKLHKDVKYLDKPAMQKELARLFEDSMHHYHHVLRAVVRLSLLPATMLEEESLRIYKQLV